MGGGELLAWREAYLARISRPVCPSAGHAPQGVDASGVVQDPRKLPSWLLTTEGVPPKAGDRGVSWAVRARPLAGRGTVITLPRRTAGPPWPRPVDREHEHHARVRAGRRRAAEGRLAPHPPVPREAHSQGRVARALGCVCQGVSHVHWCVCESCAGAESCSIAPCSAAQSTWHCARSAVVDGDPYYREIVADQMTMHPAVLVRIAEESAAYHPDNPVVDSVVQPSREFLSAAMLPVCCCWSVGIYFLCCAALRCVPSDQGCETRN